MRRDRLLFQIRERVVVLVAVFMMDDATGFGYAAGMCPPNQMMAVAIPPTISLTRIVRWRDDQDVWAVSHGL
jgi:hypothetical protein